ncbi:hypothetical protein [Helicobacter ganmani]
MEAIALLTRVLRGGGGVGEILVASCLQVCFNAILIILIIKTALYFM